MCEDPPAFMNETQRNIIVKVEEHDALGSVYDVIVVFVS